MSGDNFMGGVIIAPNMKKQRDVINTNGDIISDFGGQVIQKNDPGYVPTKEEIEKVINLPKEAVKPEFNPPQVVNSVIHPLTIQQQIDEAKKHLADLELQKKEEIARRKKELMELENS